MPVIDTRYAKAAGCSIAATAFLPAKRKRATEEVALIEQAAASVRRKAAITA
jgi:hypothetical protein